MLEVPKFMKNDYIFLLNYRGPKVTRGITLVFCNTFLSRMQRGRFIVRPEGKRLIPPFLAYIIRNT